MSGKSILGFWPGPTLVLCSLMLSCSNVISQEPAYQADFSEAKVGSLPKEFMVLNGKFTVQEEDGKRFIELPGAPLDTFQLLFGPAQKADVVASARCWGSRRGRLYPTFALGLNGQSGFRLQVSPAKRMIELYLGAKVVAREPFSWKSDEWTSLKLELRKTGDGEWTARGKVWPEDAKEPEAWQVTGRTNTEPPKGKASIWGSPFSGKSIRYKDLKIEPATPSRGQF